MSKDPDPAAVPVAVLEYEHSPLEDAVIRYRKQLILVGVLAVVGSTAYFGSKLWKESKHKDAALAFTRAQTVGELRAVATEKAGQTAAGNARLQAALLLTQDGKGKEAMDELNSLLTSDPKHPLAELAKFRLADIQLAEGATQDALTKFQEISGTPKSPYAALALLRTADQKWQEGKTDDAKKLYQELLTKGGGDRMFQIAEQRLKQIKINAPVLIDYVPEPTPAAPPGSPGAPGENAPPSANALNQTISAPGLGDDPAAAGESLLPPPVLPATPK